MTPISPRGRWLAFAAAVVLLSACKSTPPRQPDLCLIGGKIAKADAMLNNRYRLNAQPEVELPVDLTWAEDPFGDKNWRFKLHNLRWLNHFRVAFERTGDERYRTRYREILADWFRDNPREDPPSKMSWTDHPTGLRSVEFACASSILDDSFLEQALLVHGATLEDEDFYLGRGNHAHNQNLGLLAAGCRTGRDDWVDLAERRILELGLESIDEQGVTNEQSIFYQGFNYRIYKQAKDMLNECGRSMPKALANRRQRMPSFLAHAMLPDGRYESLGDTKLDLHAKPLPDTPVEFAATLGKRGDPIEQTSVVYDAGFAFGRARWADTGQSFLLVEVRSCGVSARPPRRHLGHALRIRTTPDTGSRNVRLQLERVAALRQEPGSPQPGGCR